MTNQIEPNLQGWIPQKPDSRDYQLPKVELVTLPASVSSLTKSLPIFDQGALGSCTAYGSGRAFRFIDKQDNSDFDVSELAHYYNSRLTMGQQYVNQDSGCTIRDAVKALANYGLGKESDWPYNISKFTQVPPQPVYDWGKQHEAVEYVAVPNDVVSVQTVLAAGFPVIVGFTVYQNYQQGLATGVWPEPQGSSVGGHCVLIDGYDPGWWLFPNSWGAGVGQQGWFRISWSYLQQNGADFWVVKKVSQDVVPPSPQPTNRAFHYDRFIRQDWLKYNDTGEEFVWTSSGRYN